MTRALREGYCIKCFKLVPLAGGCRVRLEAHFTYFRAGNDFAGQIIPCEGVRARAGGPPGVEDPQIAFE